MKAENGLSSLSMSKKLNGLGIELKKSSILDICATPTTEQL